jgi:hypothetical protein
MEPRRPVSVRELARDVHRSPSTVSTILASMRRSGLLDADNALNGDALFWRVAERWPRTRTLLARLPKPDDAPLMQGLRMDLHNPDSAGWALTDSAAAVAYGAPLAYRANQTLDFFVPDQAIMRRAMTLLGTADSPRDAELTVRVGPVPAVTRRRVESRASIDPWPLTHPVFVALDLALDAGRGREVLESWTPPSEWTRVW